MLSDDELVKIWMENGDGMLAGLRAVAEAAVKDAVGGEAVATSAATFKNFHRSLCVRFGYMHDDHFWWRDLISLEEWIDRQVRPQASAAVPDEWREVLQDLVTRFDERLPLREAGIIWKQAKALLAASQQEGKS